MIENPQVDAAVAARECELRATIADLRDRESEHLATIEVYRVQVYELTKEIERLRAFAGKELI